jgi:hypothetical protein
VLGFVGVKMILAGLADVFHQEWMHISSLVSLGVIVVCLAGGVVASILRKVEEVKEDLPAVSLAAPKVAPAGDSAPDSKSDPPAGPLVEDPAPASGPRPDPAATEMEP